MSTALSAPVAVAAPPNHPAPAVSGIPFRRLLRVEWFKTVDTRASRWLLALVAVVTIGMMFAPVIATKSFEQGPHDYLGFAAFAVSLLLPVVAVLVMTSEWSQRTVLTTFTQEPRRGRVMLAKIGATAILTVLACIFAAAVAAIALGVSAGLGRDVSWHVSASVTIGAALGIALNVAMGVGFGALLQRSAIAIVAIFVLPTAFALLARPLHSVGQWIDPSHMLGWVTDGHWSGHVAKILVAMLIWIALPIAAGIFRTVRREVN